MLSGWDSLSKQLRRFDAYPKTLEDFRIKTFAGATVTIISGVFMLLLLFSELSYYWTLEVHPELFVDMSQGHKLKININITFPYLPCDFISLDAIDVSGQRQLNVDHTLFKQRLNEDGSFVDIEAEKIANIGVTEAAPTNATELLPDRCESCFGAETKEIQCCNNCDDVKEAYRRKGWAFPQDGSIPQCEREGGSQKVKIKFGEGCILYGHLEVNKVAGNFHISPGSSYEVGHMHVHDLAGFGDTKINVSHTINHLSFGTSYPGQIHPLDSVQVHAIRKDSAFQYYLKIVPTTYSHLNGSTVRTNQFSVTRHEKVTSEGGESSLPGMFVSYELSPMMVRYVEKHRSFLHFLTSVCAIVGGVFTVAGILDSFIYHGTAALQRKMELGKLT